MDQTPAPAAHEPSSDNHSVTVFDGRSSHRIRYAPRHVTAIRFEQVASEHGA